MIAMDNPWFYRKQVIHNSKKQSIHQFIRQVNQSFKDHSKAWGKNQQQSIVWIPPPLECISVTFDVVVRVSGSTSVAIGRSNNNVVSFIVAEHSSSCNPNQGEAMATYIRVKEAQRLQLKKIRLEGDSQRTITTLKDSTKSQDWIAEGINCDTIIMLNSFEEWETLKIHCYQNRCTHGVAQWAAANNAFGSKPLTEVPPCLLDFHNGKDPPLL